MKNKIQDRMDELNVTIEQLNEFDRAVDMALEWLTQQEVDLKKIVVVQDEDSVTLLIVCYFTSHKNNCHAK